MIVMNVCNPKVVSQSQISQSVSLEIDGVLVDNKGYCRKCHKSLFLPISSTEEAYFLTERILLLDKDTEPDMSLCFACNTKH